MTDQRFKEVYTFFLLILTVAWAAFSVWVTYKAVTDKQTVEILGAAGAGTLLGSLIAWCANVNQFWFRKAPSETPPTTPPAAL